MTPPTTPPLPLPVLEADCSRCFGLCCVLLPFRVADGFGADKPGGQACGHLQDDDRCGIHRNLVGSGWPGCAAYDCRGAGQQVSQVTYGGVSWRDRGNLAEMAAVLSVVRVLHGLLERLAGLDGPEATGLRDRIILATAGSPEQLLLLNLDDLEDEVAAAAA